MIAERSGGIMGAQASRGADLAAPPAMTKADSGARLFAISARNFVPRLISNLSIAAVACFHFGWAWTGAWFVAVWTVVFAGIAMMNAIQAHPQTRRAAMLS